MRDDMKMNKKCLSPGDIVVIFLRRVTLAHLIMVNATGNGTETCPIKLTEKDFCFFYRMIALDRLSKDETTLHTYSTLRFSVFLLLRER